MKFAGVLSRRSAPERHVIAWLRSDLSSGPLVGLAGAEEAFARLIALARQRGIVIFAPTSPFVSNGEIGLLTRLATVQRSDVRISAGIDATEYEILLRCALLLREAGLWLPLNLPFHGFRRANDDGRSLDRTSELQELSVVKARALSLARSRQVASTGEFAAIGVSRQYVSRLCKDGLLQRIRYGWYRAVPVEERSPPAHRHHP